MPERARVFVAEDDETILPLINRLLSRHGHTVVLQAQTLAEALRCIEQFEALDVQVAVIDGNLSPNDTSGADGYQLVTRIKELTPNVITIGMSNSPVDGVHVDLGKKRAIELGRIITNL